ncbi:MAG: PAS domain S-box protein [Chloroflexi bacterium]|nr:PAS domain S-box protein [Chloroflexota bacterium]
MKIKNLVRLVLIVSVVLVALLGWTLLSTYSRINKASHDAALSEEIVRGVFELNILTSDYVLYRAERARIQWNTRHESLRLILDRARGEFTKTEPRALLTTITDTYGQIQPVFSDLIMALKARNSMGPAISEFREHENKLTAQLLVNSQSMVSDASRLNEISHVNVDSVRKSASVLIAAIFALMVAISLSILFMINRTILRPIAQLQTGVEIVGEGDLDYRIGMSRRDEIGLLSQAFDEMTERLNTTTVSRDALALEIDHRRRAEKEVQRLATIVESVDDPIIAIDTEMHITVWNTGAEKLYGYSAEEVLGTPIEIISLPGLKPTQAANAEITFKGKPISAYETQKITKSGKVVEVTTSGSPIFDEYGYVTGAVGVHHDITDQKNVERALRESEQRFNAQILQEKTRAEDIQVRKTQQLETIFEIAAVLAGPAEFQSKAEAVSRIIQERLEADSVALRMLDEERQTLTVVAAAGSRFVGIPDSLSLSEDGFSQRAFREGKKVLIEDYSKVPGARPDAIARGLKSICSIGLRGADGPNGLLNIASRHPGHFNDERVELLETIAGAIAALFESARLSDDLEQSRREIEVTDEVARIITSTLDIEAVYDDFFTEMKKLIKFDHVSLALVDGDNQQGIIAYSYDPTPLPPPYTTGLRFDLPGSLLGQVMELRKSINMPDLTEARDYNQSEELVRHGIGSLIVTPLIFEDKVIGAFALYGRNRNDFGGREQVILERLASQVAPSVRNAMLYQEADQSALAMDSIGEAVAFLDVEARIRHVNRTFEETFGYSSGELRGQSIEMISTTGGQDGQDREIFEQGILGGWSGEVLRRTKSGDLLNILLTVTPVKDKSGKVIGLISVSRDITERKRTAAYLSEQSRLAAVGELAAGVAHEINNPLTTILLYSQLISESDLSDETRSDLAAVSNAGRRAAEIVQSLLLFARREDPKPEAMQLEFIVKKVLELKKYDFRKSNIRTVLDFQAGIPKVLIDGNQMSQVIVNILNNAEQALVSHKNGGEIAIKTSATPEAVVLEIRDDGPGMEPELIGRIFEPFFTTKNAGDGTGLGLSICHGLVRQNRGEMWATSQYGVGSSFFSQFPIPDGEGASHRSLDRIKAPDGASFGRKWGRILVVDDESSIREPIAVGLGNDFEIVDQADNGETALDLIRTSEYDCILLDLKLPDISGMEVFEKTIEYDHRIADRIIIMTGDTASPETASFLSHLKNVSMHKPFTLDDVKERISVLLNGV